MLKNITPKWYIGIIWYLITMGLLIAVAIPLQRNWGMYGAALTQIVLLMAALAAPLLFKWKLSEVMPVRKITAKHFLGTILLYIATFITVILVSSIISIFSPGMTEIGNALGNFFVTVPFWVAMLFVAVLPGICEEVLFRGVILHTMRKIKSEFTIMLIVAVLFGIFHLDIYRFLPTAILGFAMTYLMLKTGNFLLPVFYHFINNAVSIAVSYKTFSEGVGVDTAHVVRLEEIGALLIFAAIVPVLYYFAGRLLNPARKNKKDKYAIIAISVALFVSGCAILINYGLTGAGTVIMNFNMTEYVDNDTAPVRHELSLENSGYYNLSFSIKDETETIITEFVFKDEAGVNIFGPLAGADIFGNKPQFLEAGIYTIEFSFDNASSTSVPVTFEFTARKIGG